MQFIKTRKFEKFIFRLIVAVAVRGKLELFNQRKKISRHSARRPILRVVADAVAFANVAFKKQHENRIAGHKQSQYFWSWRRSYDNMLFTEICFQNSWKIQQLKCSLTYHIHSFSQQAIFLGQQGMPKQSFQKLFHRVK